MTERCIEVRKGKLHVGTESDHFLAFIREKRCWECQEYEEERLYDECWCCGGRTYEIRCKKEGWSFNSCTRDGKRPCRLRHECNNFSDPRCPHYHEVLEMVE